MESLAQTLAAGRDPDEIGARVVAGVLANEPYILPDGTLCEIVRARFKGMLDAMERAAGSPARPR